MKTKVLNACTGVTKAMEEAYLKLVLFSSTV